MPASFFPNYVFNSVFVAVVGVILTVTVCSLAGYAFAKMDFKGGYYYSVIFDY